MRAREHFSSFANAFFVVVLALAAIEIVLVRMAHPNQPTEAVSFLHVVFLWGGLALFALVPTLLLGLRRRAAAPAGSGLGPAFLLVFFAVAPVLAHHMLDRHTSIGQNVRALWTWRPWLELAVAIAALGLGLSVAARLCRRIRRKPVGIAVAAISIAAGAFLPPTESRPDPPSSVDPELAAKPNVLLLVWDTTRAGHLAPYGYDRDTTPHLARFAEESIVFEEARSASIFTFTSHLSMLTGKYPAATGARMISRMQLDPKLCESVATLFSDAGYRTGAFVGTWVLHAMTGIRRGFEVYDDRVDPAVGSTYAWNMVHDVQAVLADKLGVLKGNGQPHWFQDFQRPASEVLSSALAWIGEEDPRPWFCMVNLYDVHWPYVPGTESRERWVRPYAGPMDGYLFRSNNYPRGYVPTPEDGRHVSELYDAEMWQLDAEVDRFLSALDLARSNTAVVLTSDHGEAFGEGGRFEHDDILEPQVRVPLLVRLPGPDPETGRRSLRASGVDIAPTLLSLAGLELPEDLHGVDLLSANGEADREILVEDRDHEELDDVRIALYSGTWKLVRLGVGDSATFHLYDLATDPVGVLDVAKDHTQRTLELARRLEELRAPWADLDLSIEPAGGAANEDALGGLGYLGEDRESVRSERR